MLYEFFVIYFIIVSILAVLITIFDKISAKLNKWRTPEKVLLTISALGGSVAMLLTMFLIRHKTRKPKFMIGIPVTIALQTFLIVFVMVAV
ncbi:MAG: DUF1294 domain-containing protein [Ruminococcus sp.]|nr:DUF1294 domain-containing protein [Ruminococcus sp.]